MRYNVLRSENNRMMGIEFDVLNYAQICYYCIMNNQAFIDGQNLYLGTERAKPSWHIDYGKFRVYLKEKYKVIDAYYFMGAYDDSEASRELYSSLQRAGYILVFREHTESLVSKKKGNVDTDIVFSIMKKLVEREKIDKIVLVSGDGDYWRMVDYLIKKKKFEKLLVPSQHSMSSLYSQRTPDVFRDFLDKPTIKRKISYRKK